MEKVTVLATLWKQVYKTIKLHVHKPNPVHMLKCLHGSHAFSPMNSHVFSNYTWNICKIQICFVLLF